MLRAEIRQLQARIDALKASVNAAGSVQPAAFTTSSTDGPAVGEGVTDVPQVSSFAQSQASGNDWMLFALLAAPVVIVLQRTAKWLRGW